MTHDLKTWPLFFKQIKRGYKKFELRKSDRDYKVDDILYLREFDPKTNNYTGESQYCKITCIVKNVVEFGLMDGFCILGIKNIK